MLTTFAVALFLLEQIKSENVPATKVFILPIEPTMFNWTLKIDDSFSYRASLVNAPDLPRWIDYLYSKRHKTGFLYGVPPQDQKELEIISTPFHFRNNYKRNVTWVQVVPVLRVDSYTCKQSMLAFVVNEIADRIAVLVSCFLDDVELLVLKTYNKYLHHIEIIGLNRRTYETRRRVIHLNVEDKLNAARNQVHMKIDNLNVEDFFDLYRMSKLLNIFKYKLWKESFFDLYFTFLSSAVSLGARLPLRPTEGEGVVVRLGSVAEFSNALIELQDEVKPLWKLQSCPRDFKRTSVERIFRDEGFILDWCNFKLVRESSESTKPMSNLYERPAEPEFFGESIWSRPTKAEVSRRSYAHEFAFTILVPAFIMILLVVMLSVILGFQREGTSKRKSVTSEVSTSQFLGNPSRASSALRTFSPELNGTSCSLTSSPQTASRTIVTNGLTRPTPPPYNGAVRTTVVDF